MDFPCTTVEQRCAIWTVHWHRREPTVDCSIYGADRNSSGWSSIGFALFPTLYQSPLWGNCASVVQTAGERLMHFHSDCYFYTRGFIYDSLILKPMQNSYKRLEKMSFIRKKGKKTRLPPNVNAAPSLLMTPLVSITWRCNGSITLGWATKIDSVK